MCASTSLTSPVPPQEWSAEIPAKKVNVHGYDIHYYESGTGDPIICIHGFPTSSYLWRNILPTIAEDKRVIALDLIGMGESDKPDIAYRIFDHIHYLTGFIKALKLKNVTLMMHGFGSVIGLGYAMKHSKNIAGIILLEAFLAPSGVLNDLSLLAAELVQALKSPDKGYSAVVKDNLLVERMPPGCTLRKLSEHELDHYRTPFTNIEKRKVLWQFVQDLPFEEGLEDIKKLIREEAAWLTGSAVPKLLMYCIPGFLTTINTITWARDHLNALTIADIGDALHYPQETCPENVTLAIKTWLNAEKFSK